MRYVLRYAKLRESVRVREPKALSIEVFGRSLQELSALPDVNSDTVPCAVVGSEACIAIAKRLFLGLSIAFSLLSDC